MHYKNFMELPVWQVGMTIVELVYKMTEGLPKKEDYALTSQIRRAALSITGNIAEGFGRGHKKDKINFYYYSRGSSMEVMNFIIAGRRLNYFTNEQMEIVTEKCNQIVFELNKLIKVLNYSQPQPKP